MTMSSQPLVSVEQLSKRYGDVQALNGISFTVHPGEILGFLGHNGAGKTTTLRILTGRTLPTAGSASIGGFDVQSSMSSIKPMINLVFEEQNLYERFSGRDNLRIFARLYGAPTQRGDDLLERVGLSEAASRKVKDYSTGMKQRLLVARALLNEPQVLFLDEPTRGLDPTSAREIRTIIREVRDSGSAVMLTTHNMEEADELSDRVAFLSMGEIVALGSPRDLKLTYGSRAATAVLADRTERTFAFDDQDEVELLKKNLSEGNVLTLHSQEGTLEDVFIALAGRSLL